MKMNIMISLLSITAITLSACSDGDSLQLQQAAEVDTARLEQAALVLEIAALDAQEAAAVQNIAKIDELLQKIDKANALLQKMEEPSCGCVIS